ncbi:murein biosynthesis integral membrane protein MurJ [Thermanaerosceptrum fracticalcis]|uniref:Probable lipid II flippase MurJ n=1 Tax=Thermanaerosceptrum fracticalcis TaxID=1712410 RepID=A0A7G6E262_THEFR|nr:murein biosynthesis integral membrane protein MurJ [Thermanaerosceptrum fracticalcis]QNB46166.1 murein biosynthesis integral membrane protein MurJ [Thermanaerosceptrum fracticalcis]
MSTGTKVAKAAGIIMVAMVLSRIIGYVRDMVILARFGQNKFTDAYNAAFSIPDFLYYLLVGGALSSAFIPVFSSYIATQKEEDGWRVASTIFNIVIILMLVGITIGFIFAPALIYILVPGFSPDNLDLTVKMTRIMFLQTFFMALNGISMGILNSYQHFLAPAVGSVMYNLGIIVVGLLLAPSFGIVGFAIGVVVGAALNFAVQLPALLKLGLRYRPIMDLSHPGVKKIGTLILPVLIGLSVTHFNLFVNQNLGSSLSEGMITALRNAQRIMQLPIGIFAIAIAVAVFPTLTGHAARGEKEEFKKTMSLGVRTIIFVTLPAAVGLIALKTPVVRLLFQQGKFTVEDTRATAYALLFYSIGLFAYSAIQLLNRVFYSLQDTRTPVTVGIGTILVNIALNFLLIKPLGHGGLALAYSIAGIVNLLGLLLILRQKIGGIDGKRILASFTKTLLVSLVMGLIAYLTARFIEMLVGTTTKFGQLLQVGGGVSVGVLVFAVLVLLLKMEEGELAKSLFLRRFQKRR